MLIFNIKSILREVLSKDYQNDINARNVIHHSMETVAKYDIESSFKAMTGSFYDILLQGD